MRLTFSVLGPVRVWCGSQELATGRRQQRAVLTLLLVQANQVVPVDELVDLLWRESPPSSAVNIVHRYIGAVRRVFEPDLAVRDTGRWLLRQGGGYRLGVEPGALDLLEFRRMADDARHTRREGRLAEAFEQLAEALGLWRGFPSDGLRDTIGNCPITRLTREYTSAVTEAAQAGLECGLSARIIGLVERAAMLDPFDESLQAQLMLALAATGQQASALAHYEAVRDRLRGELGIDPGEEIRHAQHRILQQDVRPGDAPLARGRAAAPERPAVPGDDAASPVRPAQLPAAVGSFVGRQAELHRANDLVRMGRACGNAMVVIAVSGTAGIGKSTFAVHWAHRTAPYFPDGQLYLNLRGFDRDGDGIAPADALRTLLYAVGASTPSIPDALEERIGLYRSILAGKRMVVVLDNARDSEQVRPLLPGSRKCLVVVTSRNPLTGLAATEGAHLFPLGLPSIETAREVLRVRIGAARVDAEPEAVGEIIELCGALPLALAVVSARAATHPEFSLAAIAQELRRTHGRLDAFRVPGVSADPRTVFSWSYNRLGEQAAMLFRMLSVHPGAEMTVASMAGLLGVPPTVADALVSELRNTSLISERSPGRYFCHDLVRSYAQELSLHHDGDAGRTEALGRVLDHYLQSSYRAQVRLRPHRFPVLPRPARPGVTPEEFEDYKSALDWFGAERHVLAAAVSAAAEAGTLIHSWQLALTFQQFCQWRGLFHDWLSTQTVALRAAERDMDRVGQAHLLCSLAGARYHLGRHDEALRDLARAQELCTEVGQAIDHAFVHTSFGEIYSHTGRQNLAISHFQRALALYRKAGYRSGEAKAVADIGAALLGLGELDAAVAMFQPGIELARQVQNRYQEGTALKDLGEAYTTMGRPDLAVETFQASLERLREVGHLPMQVEALIGLGDALVLQNRCDDAAAAWREAQTIHEAFQLKETHELKERLRRLDSALSPTA